jgi:hypothetical protein
MADTPAVPSKDIARIRQVLARELETISEYEELARAAESNDVRAFFLHLAEEEKEHVAEATYLLARLDPGQRAQNAKDFSQAHFLGGPGTAPANPDVAPAPAPAPSSSLTVSGADSKDGYIPEGTRLPNDPRRLLHALPAPPSPRAGNFSVGPLKGTRL